MHSLINNQLKRYRSEILIRITKHWTGNSQWCSVVLFHGTILSGSKGDDYFEIKSIVTSHALSYNSSERLFQMFNQNASLCFILFYFLFFFPAHFSLHLLLKKRSTLASNTSSFNGYLRLTRVSTSCQAIIELKVVRFLDINARGYSLAVDCIYPWTHARKTCFQVTSNVWVSGVKLWSFPAQMWSYPSRHCSKGSSLRKRPFLLALRR